MILSLPRINSLLTFFCIVGLGLSLYAYIVEIQLEHDDKYSPMCDIKEKMKCSTAFKSKYGKGFGLFPKDSPMHKPNSLFGLMFYSMIATLAQSNSRFMTMFSFIAIVVSNLMSLYFAYILYFILQDFCVVCISIYVVNIINFILIQLKMKVMATIEENKTKDQMKKKN